MHVCGQLAQRGFVRQVRPAGVAAGRAIQLRGQRDLRVGLAGAAVFALNVHGGVFFGARHRVLHQIANGHALVGHAVHE